MLDTVIRGGRIVDGAGNRPFAGDIGIAAGKIVEIGKVSSPAREEIDADGALVTPGFIDIHTHYDGQFIWDSQIEPSFSHGVTTAVAGSCGVGFAPVRHEFRKELMNLMEGVEDIPGIVLDEGLDWNWDSFPDYLDRIARQQYTIDVANFLPQAPLRVFVMGERALRHQSPTQADLEQMSRIVTEAMEAGAIGVSISRIHEHRSSTNDYVPGTFAEEDELTVLATAMGKTGKGVLQVAPLGAAGDFMGVRVTLEQRAAEHARYERLAMASGRPVNYFVHEFPHDPGEWRKLLALTADAQARGIPIFAQVSPRSTTLIMTLDGYHPFEARPSYKEVAHLPCAQRAAAMRDAGRRAAILREESVIAPSTDEFQQRMRRMMELTLASYHAMRAPLDYEPDESTRFAEIAKTTNMGPDEVCYDYLTEGNGDNVAMSLGANYVGGNLDPVHEMLRDPNTLTGLGDGGAHLQVICDGSLPTFQLAFWAKDRKRGPKLPIELLVHKQTGKTAALLGLSDRGIIEPGRRADINIIDLDRLACGYPHMQADLPKGGKRILQGSTGYVATLVNGATTRRNDQPTGAMPGRLVRSH